MIKFNYLFPAFYIQSVRAANQYIKNYNNYSYAEKLYDLTALFIQCTGYGFYEYIEETIVLIIGS